MGVVTTPWLPAAPVDERTFPVLRRRAIFDCCKWDPQVGDTSTIARSPLIVARTAWSEVVSLAEALAGETLAAERELVTRPELHRALGLPRGARHALRRASAEGPARAAARLMRFDFHYTTEGWRISEVNGDVPGGLNEASGLPPLFAPYYADAVPVGDPAGAYARALATAAAGGTVAFLHATAYSDDQQMMAFVARQLAAAGAATHLASPGHVRWQGRTAYLAADWWHGRLDLIVRFFPAEWLSDLPQRTGWPRFFAGADTPSSNPATALLVQTKRFPLVWAALRTPLPTWRALLPETRDPRDAPWARSSDWVLKPALGRVGEGIGLRGVVDARELRRIARGARWFPAHWVAQRRFEVAPLVHRNDAAAEPVFPCLGVYTLDTRVIGAYARVAGRPLIDARAADAAVLAA